MFASSFDIGIVGGGMVGSFAAHLLAPHFSVALIEPKTPEALGPAPQLRVSAITPASYDLLVQHAIWPHIDESRIGELLTMEIQDEAKRLFFHASEIGRTLLGFIIENEHLNAAIYGAMIERGVQHFKTKCRGANKNKQGFDLALSEGGSIQVKLLVIAEGVFSSLRNALHIPLTTMDYGQTAVVANIESTKPHAFTAFQRFLPSGPLAFLPLYEPHLSSIVWTLENQKVEAVSPKLIESLMQVFPDLGALKLIGEVGQFPLFAQQAKEYCGDHFVLVGDTAHAVHPLAGQGVNLGFHDVTVLVNVLQEARLKHENWNERLVLARYAQCAKRQNVQISQGFSLLNRLYQEERASVKAVRRLGWKALTEIDVLKRMMMKKGVG